MIKVCKHCSSNFEITPEDLLFLDKMSSIFNGKKYRILPPTLCPTCRIQRRWNMRNDKNLYSRKCDLTGENIISLYSSDKPHKVYKDSVYWTDAWDPISYGKDFDFSKSFFEQFKELQLECPTNAMHQDSNNENCEHTTFSAKSKNCYMSYGFNSCEEMYYSGYQVQTKHSVDTLQSSDNELLYEGVKCSGCYNCRFCWNCDNCSNSFFLENCRACKNCIGCKNLRNKEYHIFNQPVSKEEYDSYKEQFKSYTFLEDFKVKFENFTKDLPTLAAKIINCENSSGNFLENTKNCYHCFDGLLQAEDCRYCQIFGWDVKDMMDATLITKQCELMYEVVAIMELYNSMFCNCCFGGSHLFYCDNCMNCEYCFGCYGLMKKKYCILNKQYTKEEYETLVPKILAHMQGTQEFGEFFPFWMSPFAYNETVAHEFFPLSQKETEKFGFPWMSDNPKEYSLQKYETPDSIDEINEGILKEVLACNDCGRNYKVIMSELQFYKKSGVPIPHTCPKCRYLKRLHSQPEWKLLSRKCEKCKKEVQTNYLPEKGERIYCEKCFLETVY